MLGIETATRLLEALRLADRLDLYKDANDLNQEITRLSTENHSLTQQRDDLRRRVAELERGREMRLQDGAYWVMAADDTRADGPFCPSCLKGPEHLEMPLINHGRGLLVCAHCKYRVAVPGYVAPADQYPTVRGMRNWVTDY